MMGPTALNDQAPTVLDQFGTSSLSMPALAKAIKQFKGIIKRLISPWIDVPLGAPRKVQQLWSIGIYMGESPFDFVSAENVANPVLTPLDVLDVPAAFVADPFMLCANHRWFMFFEVMNRQRRKGEIGLAISEDGMNWTYQQIVLFEPFHLSYPYVFEWMGEYYMVPESGATGSVRLYKALKFPLQWSFIGTLLNGPSLWDPSIFHYAGKWWLFVDASPEFKHDTLRLFHADDLMGSWLEHPQSPIIEGNPHIARPAGRVLVVNGRVIRYAQDCYPTYGTQVRAFEITELTTSGYHERGDHECSVLRASGAGWNGSGMHHIDAHLLSDGRWLACVDGWMAIHPPGAAADPSNLKSSLDTLKPQGSSGGRKVKV